MDYSNDKRSDETIGGESPERWVYLENTYLMVVSNSLFCLSFMLRLHLLYCDLLDLGEVATRPEQFEEAERYDELWELQQPPDPNRNYLAGAEGSWWQKAFRERLVQLEGASSTDDKTLQLGNTAITTNINKGNANNGLAGNANSNELIKTRVW